MSKRVKSRAQELRKRKPSKAYEQGFGQNGGVSSLGTTYEDTDSDGVLDTIVKNSPRIGAFKREVGVVNRSYLPQPAPVGPVDNPPTSTTIPDMTATGTVALASYFTDADGDTITYAVSSSDPTVATVSETGGTLTVAAGTVEGTATITVTATANGKSVTETFDFINFVSSESLAFDGTNTELNTNSNFLSTFQSAFSIGCWFKRDTTNTTVAPFGSRSAGLSGDCIAYMTPGANHITFWYSAGGTRLTVNLAHTADTNWHHLAATVTQNGANVEIRGYIDGVYKNMRASAIMMSSFTAPADFVFGARKYNNNSADIRFVGKLDEGFITEYALTDGGVSTGQTAGGDIATVYNNGAPADLEPLNPVGWWRMGEGAAWDGTNWTVPDLGKTGGSPSNNHATSANLAQADRVPAVPPGYSRKAVDFDGTDDYMDIASSSAFSFGTGDFTTSIWFKLSVAPSALYRCIYDFRGGGSDIAPSLYTSNVSGWRLYAWNGSTRVNYDTLLSSGQWYHAAYVREGTTGTIYLNGSSVASSADSGNYTMSTPAPRVGGPPSGVTANYLNGFVDEFSVFNSALSASDIADIYNSGTPDSLSTFNPVGWWRMGDGDTFPTLTDHGSGGNNGTMTNMTSGDIVTNTP